MIDTNVAQFNANLKLLSCDPLYGNSMMAELTSA